MNMTRIVLLTLTLLGTFNCQIAGMLIMKPRDTDMKVNHSTYFNCSTDIGSADIFWFHGTKYIYTGFAVLEPYHERFMVDRSERNGTYIYNLVILSVQPSDAGEYICAEDEGYGKKYSVQLVVLDDDPICRSNGELDEVIGQNSCNIEPDEVDLECSVTYHGNIPPDLEWKKVGENSSIPLDFSVVTSSNHFVSTLKLKGDIALNNSLFACETKRTTQESQRCTSQVIKILYAVSNNSTVNKTINDEIHCKANTSQSCSYRWKWMQDNAFTIESSTSVLKAKKPGWHRCETECFLRNISCNLLVMRAMVYDETVSEESSQTKTIIISVLTTVIVLLVIVFVAIILPDFISGHGRRDQSQHDRNLCRKDGIPLTELTGKLSAICGLTILNQEVFLSRRRQSDIEVYDSTAFNFRRRMAVNGMTHPVNIASCSVNNCLYASNSGDIDKRPAILKFDPVIGHLVKFWNIDGNGGQVSIASDAHVILVLSHKDMLYEYTADGELIRKIILRFGTDYFDDLHAVKLPNGRFVVGHGRYSNPQNKIYVLSTKERTGADSVDEVEVHVTCIICEKKESFYRLMTTVYLSANKEGLILFTDESNSRAVLYNSDFKETQILVSEKHGIGAPWRTCFDESTGQWFVADGFCLMVCRVKDKGRVERKRYDLVSL